MSGFNGINQFGSLTVNGQKLKFEDFDIDKNGDVTQKEYNELLKKVELDSVEFSTVDKNQDNVISEDELAIYDQKSQMQDDIYNMSKTISLDFSGKSEYLTQLNSALKDLINDFAASYTGEIENMAKDLKTHLEDFMNESDAEKLQDASYIFNKRVDSLGAMIDNGADLTNLKEYAKEFLLAALDAGVTVKLGGTTIKTEAAITTALKKFTDGDELKAAIDEIIAGLNTTALKATIIAEEEEKADEAADKAFSKISGSEYQINSALIDYSKIAGYFDGTTYSTKGKSGHDENIRNQAKETIESSLKEQMKQQITDMLADKGISFDKVATLFENVYSESLTQTLESITSHKTNNAWLNKNKKYQADQNVQTIINNFINNFNTNITTAVDGMNTSNKDFDLQDIDYDVINKDENGNEDPIKTYTTVENGDLAKEQMEEQADKACQRMQSQLLRKAKAMCEANGIEFDMTAFTTIFNNASATAKATSISTIELGFSTIANLKTPLLTQTLVTTFQTDYTTWVNTEKSKNE